MEEGSEQQLDLSRIVEMLRRRRWWMLAGFCVALLPGLWTAITPEDTYQATAKVSVTPDEPEVMTFGEDFMPEAAGRWSFMPAQIAILLSDTVLGDVVDRMPRVAPSRPRLPLSDRVLRRIGVDVDEPAPKTFDQVRTNRIGALRGQISARGAGGNSVLEISVQGRDPAYVAYLSNTVADAYVEYHEQRRRTASSAAIEWLTGKSRDLRDEIADAEDRLAALKKELGGKVPAGRVDPVTAAIAEDLQTAELDLMATEQRLASLESRLPDDDTGSPETTTLQQQYLDTKLLLEQARLRYTDTHPEVRRLESVLQMLQQRGATDLDQADPSVQRLRAQRTGLQDDRARLAARVSVLRSAMSEISESEGENARTRAQYQRISQQLQIAQQMLDVVLRRINSTQLTSATGFTLARILDYAVPPQAPTGPNRVKSVFLALMIAVAIGIACGAAREFVDRGVYDPLSAAELIGVPFLGPIPVVDDGSLAERQTAMSRHSPAAEAYRHLRTSLLFAAGGRELKSLVVTSGVAGEGKTTVSINLATTFAAAGRRVLLIDADMRRPRVDRLIAEPRAPGLAEVLAGEKTLSDVMRTPVGVDFSVVTSGEIPTNPSELLASPRLDLVLARATTEFDLVIIDSPVLLAVTDGLLLTSRAQGVVVVHKPGSVPRDGLTRVRNDLRRARANVLGIIFNRVRRTDHYAYNTYLESPYVESTARRSWLPWRRRRGAA